MWIFDSENFLSVVSYDPTKDRYQDSPHRLAAEASDDPQGFLLVRARREADLLSLQRQVGEDVIVLQDIYADYSFRALVSRETYKRYLSLQVDRIDYGAHFKEVVKDRTEKKIASRKYSAMMTVWYAMAALQDTSPYSGKRRAKTKLAKTTQSVKAAPPKYVLGKDDSLAGFWPSPLTSSFRTTDSSSDDADLPSLIGLRSMGKVLEETPINDWDYDLFRRLDLKAQDLYWALREEGLDDVTFTEEEWEDVLDRLRKRPTHTLTDAEWERLEGSDI